MANPAELLHQELTTWRHSYANHFAPIESQRMASRHLDSIEELLDQMDIAGKRTDLFRRHFETWANLTFHHPHGWQTQSPLTERDDHALESLDHLSDRLAELVPKLAEGGLDVLQGYVDAAADLLAQDDSISEDLKLHARQVIAHLRWCIDNYAAVGDFSLMEASERLFAAMFTTARRSRHRERWEQFLKNFVYPFSAGAAANAITSQSFIQLTQLALGGGSSG